MLRTTGIYSIILVMILVKCFLPDEKPEIIPFPLQSVSDKGDFTFNKATLISVENGTVILIGATTENPYFEVNKALISRSMVIKLEPLTEQHIYQVLKNALERKDGLGEYNIKIEDETLQKIAAISNGDVRTALNGLEVATLTTPIRRRWLDTFNR